MAASILFIWIYTYIYIQYIGVYTSLNKVKSSYSLTVFVRPLLTLEIQSRNRP